MTINKLFTKFRKNKVLFFNDDMRRTDINVVRSCSWSNSFVGTLGNKISLQ